MIDKEWLDERLGGLEEAIKILDVKIKKLEKR